MSTMCQAALLTHSASADRTGAALLEKLKEAEKAEADAIENGTEYTGTSSAQYQAMISMYGSTSETCKQGAFALQNQQGQSNSAAAQ